MKKKCSDILYRKSCYQSSYGTKNKGRNICNHLDEEKQRLNKNFYTSLNKNEERN